MTADTAMMNLLVRGLTLRFVFTTAGVLLAGCGGETKLDVVKTVRPQYEAFQKFVRATK